MSRKVAAPSLAQSLFADLADGQLHSGADLARRHGVTRGGIWKALQSLRDAGLLLDAAPNSGYRVAVALTPLSAEAIRQALSPAARTQLASCEVLWQTESTNQFLLEAPVVPAGQVRLVLAEQQTAGRGRRGRNWTAPLGGALCLSLGFAVDVLPADFSALTLVVGLAVRAALQDLAPAESRRAVGDIRLKWPNDVVVGERKLAGILTELRAEAGGPAWVVVGIGINVNLGAVVSQALRGAGANPIDLATLGMPLDRNRLAAQIASRCIEHCDEFVRHGFSTFADQWRGADALLGREIVARGLSDELVGTARGIDAQGALLLEHAGKTVSVVAGEVSVRPRP